MPKYHSIPPQYCMWDCLILIIEKFMLKSWGISQIFLSGVPPFPSLVSVNRLSKMLHCPKLACQILAFPWQIFTLRPLLMQGNFGSWVILVGVYPNIFPMTSQYSMGLLSPLECDISVGSCFL